MFISIFLTSILLVSIPVFSFLVYESINITIINTATVFLVVIFMNIRLFRYHHQNEKRQLMFLFIELFILNFDIQKSVEATLTISLPLLKKKDIRQLFKYRKDEGILFLEALRPYFAHNYYESFVDLVMLVSERGGSLLKSSEVLLFSISNTEGQIVKISRIDNTYLIRFVFSWLFAMITAIIFRFSLRQVLDFESLPIAYIYGNQLFLIIFLISTVLIIENRIRRMNRSV